MSTAEQKRNWIVDGLVIKDMHQLADARMEVTWEPVDREIPEEIQYLAGRASMYVSRTLIQSSMHNDPVEYIFTRDNLWRGIRCPKPIWQLYMMAKGIPKEDVDAFLVEWAASPMKTLIDQELVNAVAQSRPWEKTGDSNGKA